MRYILTLLALCSCQSIVPLHLYDGPERTPDQTATITLSLARVDSFMAFIVNPLRLQDTQIIEVNGREAHTTKVVVLPGLQTVLVKGYDGYAAWEDGIPENGLWWHRTWVDMMKRTEQVVFTAEPGQDYVVRALPSQYVQQQSFFSKSLSFVVERQGVVMPDSGSEPWTPTSKLPDLQLGEDWDSKPGVNNWHEQCQYFVGAGENIREFTKKVLILVQTGGAVKDGFSMQSVTERTGSEWRRFIPIRGARALGFEIGADHWIEKWHEAYDRGDRKWGVTVYRVHGDDMVMFAYVGNETEDQDVLEQWAQRFLDAELPRPHSGILEGDL